MRFSRCWMLCVAVATAAAGCGSTQTKAPRTRMTVKEIVQRSKPAIVRVEADHERIGTGFAVDPSGVIATNLHVVAGARQIEVKFLDGSTHKVTGVRAFDPHRDLVLLQVAVDAPMEVLKLGDSDLVEAGDPVYAIGNPVGLDYTVSDGLISSVRNATEGTDYPELTVLQISAPISQGSSGGPLFNAFGEVIGVATAIFVTGQNLNFGVPSKYLRPLLAHPEPMTMPQFAEATTPPEPKVERRVPYHDLAVLDGCTGEEMADVAQRITDAIAVGAPLYNQGDHEACFKIYERTSMRLHEDGPCAGIRGAFAEGLVRAAGLASWTEKAWALRDTFDGVLDVVARKVSGAR